MGGSQDRGEAHSVLDRCDVMFSQDMVTGLPKPSTLVQVSLRLARIENVIAGLLIGIVFVLLLANTATRAFGKPVIWIDELAIYAMIWAGFLGASAGLATNTHIAVTLLPDYFGARGRWWSSVFIHTVLTAFFVIFAVILWRWFSPLELAHAESLAAFSAETFNYMYSEPAMTMPVPKYLFWLVLPLFCLSAFFHCLSNLMTALEAPSGGKP